MDACIMGRDKYTGIFSQYTSSMYYTPNEETRKKHPETTKAKKNKILEKRNKK